MKLLTLLPLTCLLLADVEYTPKHNNAPAIVSKQLDAPKIFLQAQPADSTIGAAISKLYKHGMPMQLSAAKNILGSTYKFTKSESPGDFDEYTWQTKAGLQYNFEDINYNEKGIELDRLSITSKQVVKHPLGIYLNKSTLAACKKACSGLKKSVDERTWKFQNNKVWYFLEFNKQNVLVKIKSVEWDTDYSG